MSADVSFQLDIQGGRDILQNMSKSVIEQSANAIAARARSIASSISSNPPDIEVSTNVGTIRNGMRAIGTVSAQAADQHQLYIAHQALEKSKDAGRVN